MNNVLILAGNLPCVMIKLKRADRVKQLGLFCGSRHVKSPSSDGKMEVLIESCPQKSVCLLAPTGGSAATGFISQCQTL